MKIPADLSNADLIGPTIIPGYDPNDNLTWHPVFIVQCTLPAPARYVIKAETFSPMKNLERITQSFLVMAKLYATVTPNLPEQRLLLPQEIALIRPALDAAQAAYFDTLPSGPDGIFWFVMEFIDQLDTLKGLAGAPAPRMARIDRLLDDNAWRALGRIAVVDFFVNNNDRFDLGSKNPVRHPQNIMIGPKGPVGLDFFDPWSEYWDLYSKDVPKRERRAMQRGGAERDVGWMGFFLTDPSERSHGGDRSWQAFAETVTLEIGDALGFSEDRKRIAAKSFLMGMYRGWADLGKTIEQTAWTQYLCKGEEPSQLRIRKKIVFPEST